MSCTFAQSRDSSLEVSRLLESFEAELSAFSSAGVSFFSFSACVLRRLTDEEEAMTHNHRHRKTLMSGCVPAVKMSEMRPIDRIPLLWLHDGEWRKVAAAHIFSANHL